MRRFLLTFALVIALAATAEADTIKDIIVFSFNSTDVETATDPVGRIYTIPGDHGVVSFLTTPIGAAKPDFIAYGHYFDMPNGTITGASLTLTLRQNDDPLEIASAVHGDAQTWLIGFLDSGTHDYTATVDPLFFNEYPGMYPVTIACDLGDFAIDKSVLTVNYDSAPPVPDPSAIPEPTSLLLLGTGLGVIGLAAWGRKKA